MAALTPLPTLFLFLFVSVHSATVTFTNQCNFLISPTFVTGAETSPLATGFPLEQGASITVSAPPNWSGRLWSRTTCSCDLDGEFSCSIDNCDFSSMGCGGGNENCMETGCVNNSNVICPTELKMIRDENTISCKAEAYLSDHFLETFCPVANGSFTCTSDIYSITFCPASCGTTPRLVLRVLIKVILLIIALVSICGGAVHVVCHINFSFTRRN